MINNAAAKTAGETTIIDLSCDPASMCDSLSAAIANPLNNNKSCEFLAAKTSAGVVALSSAASPSIHSGGINSSSATNNNNSANKQATLNGDEEDLKRALLLNSSNSNEMGEVMISSGGGGGISSNHQQQQHSLQQILMPKVSILKPLMGVDPHLATNLETFFTMNYPRQCYEVLFCVENDQDPAIAVCRHLMDKYKGDVDARLFIGGCEVGVNPKINNMQLGYQEAKYELIMISDAGIKSEYNRDSSGTGTILICILIAVHRCNCHSERGHFAGHGRAYD